MRSRRSLVAASVVLLWTWFLVRDAHPVMDTLALGLPVIVAVAVVIGLAVAVRRRRWAPVAAAASCLAFGLVAIVGPWLPRAGDAPENGVRVVAANTYGDRSDPYAVERRLASEGMPVVVIVSDPNPVLREMLGRRFDGAFEPQEARRRENPDPVMFTDLPATDLGLPAPLAGERGLRLRLEGPAGPFVVYGLHLQRPRFGPSGGAQVSVRAHARTIDRLLKAIAQEELPVVVAGDLNLVDRASGYRRLTSQLDDAVRSGWGQPTALQPIGLALLPRIDHIFVSKDWCRGDGDIFPLPGSDHRGVAATVGPCLSHP